MAVVLHRQAAIVREPKDSPALLATTPLDIETTVQSFLEAAYSSFAESFPLELQFTEARCPPDDREPHSGNRVAQTSAAAGAKNIWSSRNKSEREGEVPGDCGKRDDDDNNRGNDDRSGRKRPRRFTNASPIFACPFYTYQAIRYPAESTRERCGGFESIQRIKLHLRRKHTAHPCRSCSTAYMTRAELDQHSACGSHGQHDSQEAAWRSIYQTLFPGESIPSPYFDEIEERAPDSVPSLGLLESVIVPTLNPDLPPSPEPATLPTQLALESTASPSKSSTLAVCSAPGCNHRVGSGSDAHIHGSRRPTSQHASASRSVYCHRHRCLPCSIVDARTELAETLESSLSSLPSLSSILSHPAALRTHVGSSPSGESPGRSGESGKSSGSSGGPPENFGGQGNSRDRGLGDDSGGNGPPDKGGLPPTEEDLRMCSGYICCYHRDNPDEFGTNNPRSRWHKCETKEMSPFSELLKHYWNSHKQFICGECFAVFPTSEGRASHTKANSHCYYCFTAFPKASDVEGQLHHSDEFLSHQAQGCSRQYPQGKRDEYRWHKCCERILGHAGRDYNPYFRSRAQEQRPPESREGEEFGGAETTQTPPGLQDNELRRLQAENSSQNETIASLRREVEELRSSLSLANQRQSNLILAMSDICQVLRNSQGNSDSLPVGPNLHDQMDLWQNLQMGQTVTGLPAQALNAINAGNGQSPQSSTNRIGNVAISGQEALECPNATTQYPQLAMFSPTASFPSGHVTFIDSGPNFNTPRASVAENAQLDEYFLQSDMNISDFDSSFIDFNAVGPSQLPQVQV